MLHWVDFALHLVAAAWHIGACMDQTGCCNLTTAQHPWVMEGSGVLCSGEEG